MKLSHALTPFSSNFTTGHLPILPFLQVKEEAQSGEVTCLETAGKRQSWDLNRGGLTSEFQFLNTMNFDLLSIPCLPQMVE